MAIPPPFLLVPYLGALVAFWGGWRLIDELANALAESDALNRLVGQMARVKREKE